MPPPPRATLSGALVGSSYFSFFFAEVTFDLAHVFDFLEFCEDAIELVQTIDLQGGVDESSIASSQDRKSTRLNSSHTVISYAVFCLKKKKKDCHKSNPECDRYLF